jgi:hypothetical protein
MKKSTSKVVKDTRPRCVCGHLAWRHSVDPETPCLVRVGGAICGCAEFKPAVRLAKRHAQARVALAMKHKRHRFDCTMPICGRVKCGRWFPSKKQLRAHWRLRGHNNSFIGTAQKIKSSPFSQVVDAVMRGEKARRQVWYLAMAIRRVSHGKLVQTTAIRSTKTQAIDVLRQIVVENAYTRQVVAGVLLCFDGATGAVNLEETATVRKEPVLLWSGTGLSQDV